MARFAEKQERIERLRAEASTRYPKLWSEIISDWNTACEQDRVWLTYSANYLFCTNNIRWAMDPLTLNWRLKEAPGVDVAGDLVDVVEGRERRVSREDQDRMKRDYYRVRGWDAAGRPTPELVRSLRIAEARR